MSGFRLDGQVAVVTGAGRGLGRCWARALAAQGAEVVLVGRDPGLRREAEVVAEITAAGGRATAELGDVTDAAAMADLAQNLQARLGRVDILVNNAGITRDSSFAKARAADLQAVLDVNLTGSLNATLAFWPLLLAQGYGRVILITSSSGLAGNFGQAGYASAKMALVGLMQTLGIEGGPKGVHVNCLAPIGATEMNAKVLPPEIAARFTPEKLVPGLLLLASEAAPNRQILMGGGGAFELAEIRFSPAVAADSPEALAAALPELAAAPGQYRPENAMSQLKAELACLDRQLN